MSMHDVFQLPQEAPHEWGAERDYDSWSPTDKDGTTVHYTGDEGTQQALLEAGHQHCDNVLRGIEDYHLRKGWRGIGYGMAVCPHGTLYRLRGSARAAHNPEDSDGDGLSDNVDALGVLVLCGPGERPTPASLQQLQRVCDAMGGYVAAHRDTRPTTCPGDYLDQWVEDYTAGDRGTPDYPGGETVLTDGDSGNTVALYQRALQAWNPDALPKYGADADYGDETVEWVKRYQRAADLPATGNIDGVTASGLVRHLVKDSSGGGITQAQADQRYAPISHGHGYAPKDHDHEGTVQIDYEAPIAVR